MGSEMCIRDRLDCGPIPAFDVNAACAGFLTALGVAEQFLRTGAAEHALVVGADTMSRIVDYGDRSTCILFGDGAGAVGESVFGGLFPLAPIGDSLALRSTPFRGERLAFFGPSGERSVPEIDPVRVGVFSNTPLLLLLARESIEDG